MEAAQAPPVHEAAQAAATSKSFALPKDFRPAAVKLDNIDVLTGQDNYEDWSSQMSMVFDAMSVYDIVVNGEEPPPNASPSELEGYNALMKHAQLVFIQVISKPILKKVSKFRSPHLIWKYLKETYYRDTAFSFVHQLADLLLLTTRREKNKPITEFMDKFDDQWNRVYNVTAGSERYLLKLRDFLEEDYSKRDFLLAALSVYYPNPVDNLTTKANLTYAEVRHHMKSLSSNNQLEEGENQRNTALVATSSNKSRRPRGKKQSTSTSTKICTYCKNKGGKAEGHLWHDCRKLKRDQQRKKKQAAAQPQSGVVAQALVTTNQMDVDLPEVSNQSYSFIWKLDTCASTHMTSNIGLFEHIELHHGVVRVGGDNDLLSEGIGTVVIHAILLDNSVKVLRLNSVLYVPTVIL